MCVKLTNAGGFGQHRPAVQSGGQKSPSGAFLDARLAQSTRAHQKSFSVTTTLELFVLYVRETHECGWIRTAAATSQKTAQKQPGSRNPPAPTHLTAPVCKHTGAVLFLSAHGAAACSTSSKLRKTEHLSQTYHKKVTNGLFSTQKDCETIVYLVSYRGGWQIVPVCEKK